MTSLFDTILNMFTTTVAEMKTSVADNKPKPPMNVGEVMDAWMYLAMIEEAIVLQQVARNTTIDAELLELIEEAIAMCRSQADRIRKLMEQEGIPLPPLPGDKPKSEPSAIPLGVKMTDGEISCMIAGSMAGAMLECLRYMAEAVRTDLEVMWGHILFEHAKYGAKLKMTMKQRGWLKVPPAYHPPGLPSQ